MVMNLFYWKIYQPNGKWKYFSTWSQVEKFCKENDLDTSSVVQGV